MSIAVTVGAFRSSFRVRLFGFDRRQVLAFYSHMIRDYERTMLRRC
jgi:hypothetical protein